MKMSKIFTRASNVKITLDVYDDNEEFYCKVSSEGFPEEITKIKTTVDISKAVEKYVKNLRRNKK
jgi:hypothetical protein